MRVLLVQGSSAGGVGRHVASLARDLVRAGHDVVVAGPQEARRDFDIDATGAVFEAVPISDRPRPRSDVRVVLRLRALSRSSDVVHAHGLRAGGLAALALGPVLLARPGRDPVLVVTLHNLPVGGGVVAVVTAVLERLVARRADTVLGVSGDLVRRMQRLGASHAERALVPAPLGRPSARSRQQVRDELGLEDGVALVVTAARLAPQKGLDLLLDGVSELRRRRPDLGLLSVVAGDGPLREALEQRVAAERLPVRLLGARSDVPDLFGAADVAVSSSVWEGQPLVVQEALRAGAPLVATDVGGTGEVAGDAAVLVPYGDVGALASALAGLLDDAGARERLSAAGRARAEQFPTDADALAQVAEVYRQRWPDGKPAG
ncbi:MAG: glycosyltransferase family 4 protein [Actinomycetes bacterium]